MLGFVIHTLHVRILRHRGHECCLKSHMPEGLGAETIQVYLISRPLLSVICNFFVYSETSFTIVGSSLAVQFCSHFEQGEVRLLYQRWLTQNGWEFNKAIIYKGMGKIKRNQCRLVKLPTTNKGQKPLPTLGLQSKEREQMNNLDMIIAGREETG